MFELSCITFCIASLVFSSCTTSSITCFVLLRSTSKSTPESTSTLVGTSSTKLLAFTVVAELRCCFSSVCSATTIFSTFALFSLC